MSERRPTAVEMKEFLDEVVATTEAAMVEEDADKPHVCVVYDPELGPGLRGIGVARGVYPTLPDALAAAEKYREELNRFMDGEPIEVAVCRLYGDDGNRGPDYPEQT